MKAGAWLVKLCSLTLAVTGSLVLIACASSDDLRTKKSSYGGGVLHDELKTGVYWVRARTHSAPWPNEGPAIASWKEEATKACGGKAYKEVHTLVFTETLSSASFNPLVKYLVSEKSGYAVCDGAVLTEEEAKELTQ
jgi:hypothetical protein